MQETLTVVSFCWSGARPIYTPWHANNQQRQFAKHLTVPHRYVCVTDQPDAPEFECETVPLWDLPPVQGTAAHWLVNYVRLRLCDEWAREAIGERILAIDLDVTIRANIDDLVADDVPFRILKLRRRKQLQAGLFLVRPGELEPNPWAACFDPQLIERSRQWVGSDQALLSELFYERVVAGEFPTWDERHGIIINDAAAPGWRMLFRTGERKCWDNVPEKWIYYYESGLELPVGFDIATLEAIDDLDRLIVRLGSVPSTELSLGRRRKRTRAMKALGEARGLLAKVVD